MSNLPRHLRLCFLTHTLRTSGQNPESDNSQFCYDPQETVPVSIFEKLKQWPCEINTDNGLYHWLKNLPMLTHIKSPYIMGYKSLVKKAGRGELWRKQHERRLGFKSDPLSFPTPHLFFPAHFLSKPSLSYLIKGKKPKIKSLKKKEGCVCQMKMNRSRICLCLLCDNTVWTSHRVPFMLPRPERKPSSDGNTIWLVGDSNPIQNRLSGIKATHADEFGWL